MSYCRFADGDVYVYGAVNKIDGIRTAVWICEGCDLSHRGRFVARSRKGLLMHLGQHLGAGHSVPARAFARLEEEIANEGRETAMPKKSKSSDEGKNGKGRGVPRGLTEQMLHHTAELHRLTTGLADEMEGRRAAVLEIAETYGKLAANARQASKVLGARNEDIRRELEERATKAMEIAEAESEFVATTRQGSRELRGLRNRVARVKKEQLKAVRRRK